MAESYVQGAVEVIKQLMQDQGVSRTDLAERLGVSASYVSKTLNFSNYENYENPSTPSLERLNDFARQLNHTLDIQVHAVPLTNSVTNYTLMSSRPLPVTRDYRHRAPGKLVPRNRKEKED